MFSNITKPSRERSCTLIDNIFSNDMLTQHDTLSGLLDTDITDHCPVFYIVFKSEAFSSTAQFWKYMTNASHLEENNRFIDPENHGFRTH